VCKNGECVDEALLADDDLTTEAVTQADIGLNDDMPFADDDELADDARDETDTLDAVPRTLSGGTGCGCTQVY
jgi:hypothetical protein